MKDSKSLGRWTKLFDGQVDFQTELTSAKIIEAKWQKHPGPGGAAVTGHTTVIFSGLPGWLEPLWASDGKWLYIRRPEGVWKTLIPSDYWWNANAIFVHGVSGDSVGVGTMMLGDALHVTNGWLDSFGEPLTPADMDARFSVENQELDSCGSIDFVGPPLTRIEGDAERLIAVLDDEFDAPPKFSLAGNWLVAVDQHGRFRCGYSLSGLEKVRTAIEQGYFWMRFQGKFIKDFEVKVKLESMP